MRILSYNAEFSRRCYRRKAKREKNIDWQKAKKKGEKEKKKKGKQQAPLYIPMKSRTE